MNQRSIACTIPCLCAILLGLVITGLAFAHDVVSIGHNSGGQLAFHFQQKEPAPLYLGFRGVKGWAGANLGFESLFEDMPAEDLFVLPNSTDIQLVLDSADPNMHLFSLDGSGFLPIGGTYELGAPYFHLHPFWNLTAGEYGVTYQVQVSFIDTTGQFTPSDPVTILFAPFCPGDVNMSAAVDVADLLAVIVSWGPCPDACTTECAADLDHSCTVNVADLLTVINSWGPCIPPP